MNAACGVAGGTRAGNTGLFAAVEGAAVAVVTVTVEGAAAVSTAFSGTVATVGAVTVGGEATASADVASDDAMPFAWPLE